MDQIEKLILQVMLAIGRREEALSRLQRVAGVSHDEGQKLLTALEAESPLGHLNFWQLFRYAGFGIFLVGVILIGIGMTMYFAYTSNDERQLIQTTCTITSVSEFPEGPEVTFSYSMDGRNYTITERHEIFRDLGFVKGQELALLVNAFNPNEAVLPILKDYVQKAGMRYGGMGLGLILVSIVLWRLMRARIRNQ